MPSLRDAARLLERCDSLESLGELTTLLGFGDASPLDRDARDALGLGRDVRDASCARGPGALRALQLVLRADRPMAEELARFATRIQARSPQLQWLLVVASPRGVALATWVPGPRGPHLSALVVRRGEAVDSDAETLCALAARRVGPDALLHAQWHEVLGRDALTRRFYRALEGVVLTLAASLRSVPEADGREIALLTTCRFLFLAFVESKGWLDHDRAWIAHAVDRTLTTGGRLHQRLLRPLFFGTLNTPWRARASAARALGRLPFLNGGLFAQASVERRWRAARFSDDAIARIVGDLLARHRFTAREHVATGLESAIDPEMLGRAFESLMSSRERRASGTFYTPSAIVADATTRALREALTARGIAREAVERALAGTPLGASDAARLGPALASLRLLDPACGSGAFLVHALDRLATMRAACGDRREPEVIRREVLALNLFGVDILPTAVWLCELRLWLAVVIESRCADPLLVTPLPNLDRHIRVGDALAGDDFAPGLAPAAGGIAVARLRARYARSNGARKLTLSHALDRAERAAAVADCDRALIAAVGERREAMLLARARDLFGERAPPNAAARQALDALRARVRAQRDRRRLLTSGGALPFAFGAHFPDAAAAGGFDVIVGNPPWVRLHNIPPAARDRLRRTFRVFREAAWVAGAEAARAGHGFGAQVDLSAMFVERALGLLAPGGVTALLVPAKLWRSLAGGGVRRLLSGDVALLALDDYADAPALFEAATYPSLIVVRRGGPPSDAVEVTQHRHDGAHRWSTSRVQLGYDTSPDSPLLALPRDVRTAFDVVRHAGSPLAASHFGRALLGVKCGANDAFLVRVGALSGDDAEVRAGARVGRLEAALLRPVLRGEEVTPWRARPASEAVVWTHDDSGAPLATLPPLAAAWLRPWRRRLGARSDARGERWWALFRTAAARSALPRVVWADLARRPRAAVLAAGDRTVPLNTCYVLPCPTRDDALAFAALLNSPLAAAWLDPLAEQARGGYRRYLGWTLALVPVPRDWERARALLAPLGRSALGGAPPDDEALLAAATAAFDVRPCDVAPLVEWWRR